MKVAAVAVGRNTVRVIAPESGFVVDLTIEEATELSLVLRTEGRKALRWGGDPATQPEPMQPVLLPVRFPRSSGLS